MKKIGFLVMALVLALGSLGVGYAMWFDTITIDGTVNTGSLDLEVTRVNGDDVYKDIETGELIYGHWIYDYTQGRYLPGSSPIVPTENMTRIAYSTSAEVEEDTIVMKWDNLFPLGRADGMGWDGFVGSVMFHCTGTVPVHLGITAPEISGIPADWVSYLWFVYDDDEGEWPDVGTMVASGTSLAELNCIQLHHSMDVSLGIIIKVPQLATEEENARNMNIENGSISFKITGYQWNEYQCD